MVKIRVGLLTSLLICLNLNAASKTVYVFGDSHAYFNFRWPDQVSHLSYLGHEITFNTVPCTSRTMHRIGRDGLRALNIANEGVRNGDIAIFCFGEVDCRCHIGRQVIEKKRALDEIIQTLVNNYIKTILINKSRYTQLNCAVLSVIPPCDQGFNPQFPWYGLLSERVQITKQLNQALKQSCDQASLLFIDSYHLYSDQDGVLKSELSDGCVHLGRPANLALKQLAVERLVELDWL